MRLKVEVQFFRVEVTVLDGIKQRREPFQQVPKTVVVGVKGMRGNYESPLGFESFQIEKCKFIPLLIHSIHTVDKHVLSHNGGFNSWNEQNSFRMGKFRKTLIVGNRVVIGYGHNLVALF